MSEVWSQSSEIYFTMIDAEPMWIVDAGIWKITFADTTDLLASIEMCFYDILESFTQVKNDDISGMHALLWPNFQRVSLSLSNF